MTPCPESAPSADATVTLAIAIAAAIRDLHAVMGIIGIWAAIAGVLQLSTAIRRWGFRCHVRQPSIGDTP